jgi:hypothetical protein
MLHGNFVLLKTKPTAAAVAMGAGEVDLGAIIAEEMATDQLAPSGKAGSLSKKEKRIIKQ